MKQLVFYTMLSEVVYECKIAPFIVPRKGESVIIPARIRLAPGTTYKVHDTIYDYRTGIIAVQLINP